MMSRQQRTRRNRSVAPFLTVVKFAKADILSGQDSGNAISRNEDATTASPGAAGTAGSEQGTGDAQLSEEAEAQLGVGHRIANTRFGIFRPGTRFRVGYPARGMGRGGGGLGRGAASDEHAGN